MATKSWTIEIIVPGEVRSKSNNVKMGRRGPYIPVKIQRYEQKVAEIAREAMKEIHKRYTKQQVKVDIWVYYGSERRKDLGNADKSLLDALNEVVYKDDELIVDLHLRKRYDPDNPRVEMKIKTLPNYKHFPKPDYKKREEDRQKRQAMKKTTKKKKTKKRKTKKRKKKRKT